ncbi:MAG: hypothetical protein WCN95_16435, partial [bacterium]
MHSARASSNSGNAENSNVFGEGAPSRFRPFVGSSLVNPAKVTRAIDSTTGDHVLIIPVRISSTTAKTAQQIEQNQGGTVFIVRGPYSEAGSSYVVAVTGPVTSLAEIIQSVNGSHDLISESELARIGVGLCQVARLANTSGADPAWDPQLTLLRPDGSVALILLPEGVELPWSPHSRTPYEKAGATLSSLLRDMLTATENGTASSQRPAGLIGKLLNSTDVMSSVDSLESALRNFHRAPTSKTYFGALFRWGIAAASVAVL